jgi:small GTP-binding protein
MDVFQRNGISETAAELNRELYAWKAETINIAVIGCSGVGKSTFINSMCEFKLEDSSAAKTGVIETTSNVTAYPLQRNTKVVLWDFPGFDARQIQPKKYYASKDFEIMDIVIIILSTRLTEKDVQLINTIAQQGKVYYLVRTKFDCDLENLGMQNCSQSETKLLKTKLKSSYKAALKGENEVFFIDSFMLDSHDYERFEKVLISDAKCLSQEKSISFTLALPIITEYAKTVKRELLEKRLPKRALQAALSLPLSKNIALLLKEEEDIYRQQFSKLPDVTDTSCTDVSYITNGIIDLKESLFHKRVHAAKYELFKQQDKLTERFLPLFDIVDSYELCFVWLQRCLENVLKSTQQN